MTWLCTLLTIGCALTGTARIIDGDTLQINSTHVRLAGIDAEELSEPNGAAARDHLIQLTTGAVVTCQLDGWSYSRRTGVCYTNHHSLNATMVADGYALDCARYSKGLYRHLEPAGVRDRLRQKRYC